VTAESFADDFDRVALLEEAGSMSESSSKDWWLSSGGKFFHDNGIAGTQQGELPESDKWRKLYSETTPVDTDNGYHPQNIFRLVLRKKWKDFKQEAYFRITADNLYNYKNRNEANGIFLFNRYYDGDNLYYTGLRADGAAVIKKKLKGKYYTLKYEPVITGSDYDKKSNPNLLPKDNWIGLKSEVSTNTDNSVSIKLYVDIGRTGRWQLVAAAIDNGEKNSCGMTISGAGYSGIRTDFMDVQFTGYKIEG
jgi:hypothetical protein